MVVALAEYDVGIGCVNAIANGSWLGEVHGGICHGGNGSGGDHAGSCGENLIGEQLEFVIVYQ